MMKVKKLLPVEEFIGAIIHATVLMLLLALVRHPVAEWAITAAVLYVFIWLSREVIARLVLWLLKSLMRYEERISRRLGVEMSDYQPARINPISKIISVIMVALLLSAIIGIAFNLGSLAISSFGLTPLPAYFPWIAWGLAITGLAGSSCIFGLIALVFFAVDRRPDTVNPRFRQFHAVTREVDTSIRSRALTLTSPATP